MTTEHNAYWFRRYPRTALFLVVLVGITLILLLAELATRILIPEWTPASAERAFFWHYDEVLGWAHRPNQEGRFLHKDFSISVRINSVGLRDREYPLERTGKKRMLVIGDSFAWGFGVERDQRFDETLEQRLGDWEIINAAVSGYGTDQQLLYLGESGMAYGPDVVLLLFHETDYITNTLAEAAWYNKPFFSLQEGRLVLENVPVPEATLLQRLDRLLIGRTFFLGRIYIHAIRPLLAHLYRGSQEGHGRTEPDLENAGQVTAGLLDAINAICNKNGARFVLVSIPMGQEDIKTTLDTFSRQSGVPYLALDDYFSTLSFAVEFPHDAHWNAAGHAAASKAIQQFLEREAIL